MMEAAAPPHTTAVSFIRIYIMFFGGTSFASAPFADPGFNPNALAIVTGIRLNESTGSVGIVGDAISITNR
jgi:hypothetical protein